MTNRNKIQQSGVKAIIESNYHGLFICSPRVGKTKQLIESIKDKKNWKICIVVPYRVNKESWKEEFVKWGLDFEPEIYCFASTHKLPQDIDLLVIDEIQMLYGRALINIIMNSPKRVIGLTGTISDDTILDLERRLKIKPIFNYSIDQAAEDEVISEFEVTVVLCEFDNTVKNVHSGTKKSPRIVTERAHYNFLHGQFERFKMLSLEDYSKYSNIKDYYARKRKELIYEGETKLKCAKSIIDKLDRVLVFSGNIAQVDKLTEFTYHSKNKEKDNLRKFQNKEINKLGTVQMSSVGVTLPVKNIVIHQLQSNSEMSLQKILRACNFEKGKVAQIYITCYKNSIDGVWVTEALKDVRIDRIKWIEYKDLNLD